MAICMFVGFEEKQNFFVVVEINIYKLTTTMDV
jgi:hypothetical protein